MTRIQMGKLIVGNHESETISEALGVQEGRFGAIFEEIEQIYNDEDRISKMIERCVTRFKDSELALALMVLGIIRERVRYQQDEE